MSKWRHYSEVITELISLYTVHCVSKTSTYYFLNNSVKNHPIFINFGKQYPDEIWHLKIINLPTSPIYCGYTTSRIVKSHSSTMLSHVLPNIAVRLVYQSWHVARQHCWLKSCGLPHLWRDTRACVPFIMPGCGQVVAAADWDTDMDWIPVEHRGWI